MPVEAGQLYEITVGGAAGGDNFANVWHAMVVAVGAGEGTATELAEAFWNHVKGTYRAVATTAFAAAFTTVRCEQVNTPNGLYGTYSIPPGEQSGTRVAGTQGQESPLPYFSAIGVRLEVGSKLTRPGQKRLWGLSELDNVSGTLQAPARAAAEAFMNVITIDMLLGAPSIATVLRLCVRKTAPLSANAPYQDVTGFFVQPTVRSQVSRRPPTVS